MNLRAIYDKVFSTDVATWIGHGVLGFLIAFVLGPAATFAAFLYRELSDLLAWKFDDRPVYMAAGKVPVGYKRALGPKLKDGFFDLWSPLAGAALAELLKAVL